jgi:hypothetical protein
MGLLTIIYWILLVLILIGAFAGTEYPWYPRLNSLVILVLFIIIGLKILKPSW